MHPIFSMLIVLSYVHLTRIHFKVDLFFFSINQSETSFRSIALRIVINLFELPLMATETGFTL